MQLNYAHQNQINRSIYKGIGEMNILLAHFRVGETDGVSLEMDKWKWALESLGHKVFYVSGSAGSCEAELVPELHYSEPLNDKIIHNAYVERSDYRTESVLLAEIDRQAEKIAKGIEINITKAFLKKLILQKTKLKLILQKSKFQLIDIKRTLQNDGPAMLKMSNCSLGLAI